jgi:hypothetical protein
MQVNITGTASSLSYPTIAGLRSDLIARLTLDNAPPASVTLKTTVLGSVEWHYDLTGTVEFPDDLGWSGTDLVSEVTGVLAALTGYQFTGSADTPQPVLSDVVADPVNGALQGAHTALQSVEDMGGKIAAGVEGAVSSVGAIGKSLEKDVLILGGLVILGIVVIAFSPQLSKTAGALR